MRVFVTGATGFVGIHVSEALLAAGHTVVALTHRQALPLALQREGLEPRSGDVTDPASLRAAMRDCDAVVHLVGIIREFPRKGLTFEKLHDEATASVLAATREAGITRYLHMSALGARQNSPSRYHTTKWRAEEHVRASELDWTIFRPSLVFGPGSEFLATMAGLAKAPLFPVIGGGKTRAQPIHVEDVALAFARALGQPSTIEQTYELGGPEVLTYREVYRRICNSLHRPFRPLVLPTWAVSPVAALFQYQPWFPLTRTQLTMLGEDNIVTDPAFARDFAMGLRRFPG